MIPELNQLEIEWPFDSSMRAFCLTVLAEIDKVLGTDYLKLCGRYKSPLDELYSVIRKIAELLDLVVIVITGKGPFDLSMSPSARRDLKANINKFMDSTKVDLVFQGT